MLKHRFLLFLLLVVLLAGCAQQPADPASSPVAVVQTSTSGELPAAPPVNPSETATSEPSETAVPSNTATKTPRPTRTATETPPPTDTAEPTDTPLPTETPAPSNTPTPAITSTPTPNAQGEIVHTVSAGETIVAIAKQYGVLSTQLIAYNNLTGDVAVGQTIRIPVGMMGQNYTAGGGRAVATPIGSAVDTNRVVLGPVTFDWQKMNNCGPTTTSVILSYYGIAQPQLTIAGYLKPNPADKNVSPPEVAAYVRGQGMGAFVGINGDISLLERLLAAGYPVMVEQWMQYDGGVGHYRAVRGYDRDKSQILQEDTFLGPDIWRSYDDFNRDWAYFNNTYIVFYPSADQGAVAGIIGGDWDRGTMWQRALNTFRNQSGALALYGQAEALHQLGNDAAAIPLYEQALAAGLPYRYLWYRFGYLEALNNTGQYQKTLDVSAPILQAMGLSEDIRYHRAVAYKALGQTEQARRELNLALQDHPGFGPATALLAQLPAPLPTWTPTVALPTWTPTAVATEVPPTPDPALATPTAEAPPPPPEPTPGGEPPTPEPTPGDPPSPEPTLEPTPGG